MIDTLKAKNAGFTNEQIDVFRELDRDLVTKDHLDAQLSKFREQVSKEFSKVNDQFSDLKYKMITAVVLGSILTSLLSGIAVKLFSTPPQGPQAFPAVIQTNR